MKAVILAGGMGTRLSEETVAKPKPMVEIGGKPILWHIMKIYAYYGFKEFIVCCGYKGNQIKEYFINYYTYGTDSTFHLKDMTASVNRCEVEPWKVTLANTGLRTLTAGRILRIRDYMGDEPFMLTYGDGVADINIDELISFHKSSRKAVTITVTRPDGRFGTVQLEPQTGNVTGFKEKAKIEQGWVNVGFMIAEPSIFDYLGDGSDMLEGEPFNKLVRAGEMSAYRHKGFWSPMDTIKDRNYLENLWEADNAPWKIWQ